MHKWPFSWLPAADISQDGWRADALFCAYALLPAFGAGLYRNGSGQVFFENWYLLGFLVVSFFLMHELITPLPPKDEASPGKRSGREGSGRPFLAPFESSSGR
jgi:hypothetical protein